jgi:ATP-dependent Lon protease
MNRDSLNKNVTFENIIRSKYGLRYDEKVKVNRLAYSQDDGDSETKRFNIPTVVINNTHIWPRMKKLLLIQDRDMLTTLTMATVNDRYLVIAPGPDFDTNIACLVEIVKFESNNEHVIKLEVKGLKRFKVKEFKQHSADPEGHNVVYTSNGEIIKDLEIESAELKDDIIDKIKYCERIHREVLEKAPMTISRKLDHLYGPIPGAASIQSTSADLENISLYYLNCVKPKDTEGGRIKLSLYGKTNIIERLEW